jgi:hypothetical protein
VRACNPACSGRGATAKVRHDAYGNEGDVEQRIFTAQPRVSEL